MRQFLTHNLNALHVYCRLVDLGIKREWAREVARVYEKMFAHRLLYGRTVQAGSILMPAKSFFKVTGQDF